MARGKSVRGAHLLRFLSFFFFLNRKPYVPLRLSACAESRESGLSAARDNAYGKYAFLAEEARNGSLSRARKPHASTEIHTSTRASTVKPGHKSSTRLLYLRYRAPRHTGNPRFHGMAFPRGRSRRSFADLAYDASPFIGDHRRILPATTLTETRRRGGGRGRAEDPNVYERIVIVGRILYRRNDCA